MLNEYNRPYISGHSELRPTRDPSDIVRPSAYGSKYGVSSSHFLATNAASKMFALGGNAVDAGVAGGIMLSIVEPHMCSFGGIAPIMIRPAGQPAPIVIDGVGTWPRGIELDDYLRVFDHDMPIGVERTVMPAAPAAWLTALERYGRLSAAQVFAPAIEACFEGVNVPPGLANFSALFAERIEAWSSSQSLFTPGGVPLVSGEKFIQQDLGAVLMSLVDAEQRALATGSSRESAIESARLEFYTGAPAAKIAGFMAELGWPIDAKDLADYQVNIEDTITTEFRGYTVHSTGAWSQGPLLPMTLNILEAHIAAHGRLSTSDFYHYFVEAFKLAGADREAYFGDPHMVDVPMEGLLHKDYAAERAFLMGEFAAHELPAPGDPWRWDSSPNRRAPFIPPQVDGERPPDTSHICVIDQDGNMFSALPSDHAFGSPVVPGLGTVVSHRGAQFWLDPKHPSVLQPGKRPRATPNPAMVMRDGQPVIAMGSPGEDLQCQAMIQFLYRYVVDGLPLQEAIEAPRVGCSALPSSFFPHTHRDAVVDVENKLAGKTSEELTRRGHHVRGIRDLSYSTGALGAATISMDGQIQVGSDPRRPDSSIASD